MSDYFHEIDRDQGVERIYQCHKNSSTHLQTEKQKIDLVESAVWGQMLFLDGVLQSTTSDELVYHNALVHPLLDTLREKKKILILGGGEGATAREVLRWKGVESVVMVDYDKELVDLMRKKGDRWSQGSFNDPRLTMVYDDAWAYMENNSTAYNGIIVDLTDPSLTQGSWKSLLENVLRAVKGIGRGGFVMNAGPYTPWATEQLKELKGMIEELCLANPEFKYYMYTTFIPSFNGEWTFIVVSYTCRQMVDPEHLHVIPSWIRRSIRTLDPILLDEPISTNAIVSEIVSYV
jgi:spermidine synthase